MDEHGAHSRGRDAPPLTIGRRRRRVDARARERRHDDDARARARARDQSREMHPRIRAAKCTRGITLDTYNSTDRRGSAHHAREATLRHAKRGAERIVRTLSIVASSEMYEERAHAHPTPSRGVDGRAAVAAARRILPLLPSSGDRES